MQRQRTHEKRGRALLNSLLGKALFSLKERGYSKVFGFYEHHNRSAFWAQRVAGYDEMKKRKVRQIFFYQTTEFF